MLVLRALLVMILWLAILGLMARRANRWTRTDWRLNVLSAFVGYGVLVALGSELLGTFRQLALWPVVAFWGASTLVLLAIRQNGLATEGTRIDYDNLNDITGRLKWLILSTATVIFILFLVGFIAAPNNWDSMTYHLSRVMHWQQNRTLDFYPTNILRQLHAGPWAEMAILHFQILTAGDRLANLVQWSAMVGSVIGASYLAKLIGGSRDAQGLTALIAATIPMGILQATSTQNDYVVALWITSFAAFSLTIIAQGPSTYLLLMAGASLGLAILTKATALLFAAPLGAWLALTLLRKWRSATLKSLLVISAFALLINIGHFYRNTELYGSPLGPTSESPDGVSFKYTNDIHTPGTLISNLMRNSALHLGSPLRSVNAAVQEVISRIHGSLGLDINDPRTTWTGTSFSVEFSRNEDGAGNPVHFALFFLSLILLFRYRERGATALAICIVGSFFLFCFLLKWMPWHSRLHLTLFVLSASVVGIVMSQSLGRRSFIALLCLLGTSLPYLFANGSRPVLGKNSVLASDRSSQYLRNRTADLAQSYGEVVESVKRTDCHDIGLVMDMNDWEYPIWVMTDAANEGLRVEHIAVENISKTLLSRAFIPCAVIATRPQLSENMSYGGVAYKKARGDDRISVFFPLTTASATQ